ncbi:MAG: tyrosine-type recombinase/integrase [bacterium]|nr:tyrosine-type recombinase/integrase [bacterium]
MTTTVRQLPLFTTLPASEADLNPRTRLKDTITLFQQHLLRQGKTEHTIRAFTADLQLLGEWGGDEMMIGAYTTTTLNAFLHWLEYERGVPCSRKSYARRVTTLKVFFRWLHALAAVQIDPANAILQRSGQAPLSEALNPQEIDAAFQYAFMLRRHAEKPDSRPEMLFRLLIMTGIKKGEAVNLTLNDIERSPAVLAVNHHSPKDVYKERRIDLEPDWLPVYDAYLVQYRPRDAVFTCTARNLEYILDDVGKGAGIEPKLSFEMLRWTSAVRDYRAGADPDAIRDKLGLSKISWTETFDKIKRLTDQQLKDEAEA